ncbi:initiator tRNA phosphoribosyl transferase [Neoconidiobolus thromboides FSU 785]|nr:initiator tRNA phosphoribosyl transferase [Neoconidiobolus thromboides FSU 785]
MDDYKQLVKQIKSTVKTNNKKTILVDRLNSIYVDALFIRDIYTNFLLSRFPILANERCGNWYIPSDIRYNDSVYFKSTDGHIGKWDFSLKRLNLNLLSIVNQYKGAVIVDSTQKGKSYPDSFSRTIPVYCAVINLAIYNYLIENNKDNIYQDKLKLWDKEFYAPHTVVSKNERESILNKLPELYSKLTNSSVDIAKINELIELPLRPVYITMNSNLIDFNQNNQFLHDVPFLPLILITASNPNRANLKFQNKHQIEFNYIQGAGDDEESWAKGIKWQSYWENVDSILKYKTDDQILSLFKTDSEELRFKSIKNQNNMDFIADSKVAIGNWKSGDPNNPGLRQIDLVINCCDQEYTAEKFNQKYLFLNIKEGKKGKEELFQSIDKVLKYLQNNSEHVKSILCHCIQGKDRSVGIALAILLRFMGEDGKLNFQLKQRTVDKQEMKNLIIHLLNYRPNIMPTRSTIKKVIAYFNDN